MNAITQFLLHHGGVVLFVSVFVEQLGLPLPAVPWLVAAGALAASGQLNGWLAISVTYLACAIADTLWYYLGRRTGHKVLGFLCRISLEPDTCVRRTQDIFARYGMRALLLAKFVPGLSTVAPPLAGSSGISLPRFLFFDGIGALLYGGTFMMIGAVFSAQLEQILKAIGSLGSGALGLVAGLIALYIGFKYFQRRRLLRELRMARITVDELNNKLEAGENPMILDLRSKSALKEDPALIRGAVHIGIDDVDGRLDKISRDQDIILYCSCPNEVSAARAALLLQRKGFSRVRPLLGGFDAWRERKYPVDKDASSVLIPGA